MRSLIGAIALLLVLAIPVNAATFPVTVTRFTSRVAPNANATLAITTKPGSRCTIAVYYSTTASSAAGLIAKTAPRTGTAKGKISWTWRVGPSTKPGTFKVQVRCTLGQDRGAINRNLTVV